MSGQSITDRVMAAKHSLAGQGLAKSVHKATTEEIMGPKKKHLVCKLPLLLFDSTCSRCSSNLRTLMIARFLCYSYSLC